MNSGILKFTADYLHDGRGFIPGMALLTDQEGRLLDIIAREDAGEDIQVLEGLLCPGFVNVHCHLELSHMRGLIPEHTGLVNFLIAVMKERNRADRAEILAAAEAAEDAMRETGIVAVGDISNGTDSLPVKQRGRLVYHTFVEATGFSEHGAPVAMERAMQTHRQFRQQGLVSSIVPHAPYSVSKALFRFLDDYGKDSLYSIHNQESAEEDLLFRGEDNDFFRLYRTLGLDYADFRPTGTSSLRAWLPLFSHRQPVIAVHNTFSTVEDVRFVHRQDHPFYWCLCPGANLYIGNRMPPVDLLMSQGVRIVLGTDSFCSNHALSILEELKVLHRLSPSLSLETSLSWATSHGAEALQMTDRFGRFTRGLQPGIVRLHPLTETSGAAPMIDARTRASRIK